jgi:uncharacterized membrane protein required for colicin V production
MHAKAEKTMTTNADQAIDQPAAPKQTGMLLRWRLPLMVLFFGPAIYFASAGDYVLAAVCGAAGIAAFSGYRVGAVYIFTTIAAIAAAIAYAPSIGQTQEFRFTQWFGTTGLANRFLSIGVVGLLITFVLSSVVILLLRRMLAKRPRLDSLNRWLGFSIGGLEGVAAIVFFLGGMLIVEPIEQQRAELRDPADVRGRMLSKFILATAEKTRESRIGPMLETYNPFVRVPQLNRIQEVQQSVQVLSDPAQIEGLLHHPSIEQLQRRPEVRQAMQKLNSDPEIKDILHSGRPMDRTMAMTLLSHPAVLELVDQPGFMEEAAKVMQATNLFPHGR